MTFRGMDSSSSPVILIIEDDHLIRMLASESFADAGFEVLEAENADEAIDILQRRQDIRIIFTDINMPGSMDGLKLARTIRGRWPPIHIMVASGKAPLSKDCLPIGSMFFMKPYRFAHIFESLKNISF